MFFVRTRPPELAPDALRAVRIALNTPVVSTGELPVGPARAALAVHVLASGQPDVTIAVRSLRDGALALYGFEGSFSSEGAVAVALDAALSFAEAMGFLFDEELLLEGADEAARGRAWQRWSEIAEGQSPIELSPEPEKAEPEEAEPEEALLLEDLIEEPAAAPDTAPVEAERGIELDANALELVDDGTSLELDLRAAPDDAPALKSGATPHDAPALKSPSASQPDLPAAPPAPSAEEVRVGQVPLTKFRGGTSAAPPEAEEPSQRGAALGRVPLVKRRRGAKRNIDPLLRLLGSF